MKPLPPRLHYALQCVGKHEGDDIYYVLGYLGNSTARSYMSQLKRRGLAYTIQHNGTTEVWTHPKGRELLATLPVIDCDYAQ